MYAEDKGTKKRLNLTLKTILVDDQGSTYFGEGYAEQIKEYIYNVIKRCKCDLGEISIGIVDDTVTIYCSESYINIESDDKTGKNLIRELQNIGMELYSIDRRAWDGGFELCFSVKNRSIE